MIWYKETHDKLFNLLQSSEQGLSPAEVQNRLTTYGANQLAVKKEPLWQVIIEPFRSVFVGVLVLAALVSLISHETFDAAIVCAIILVNAGIFYTQQYMTNRVLRSLKRHSVGMATVLRGGSEQEISSLDLVPGDILTLAEGERVPADARVLHTAGLQINESALTGESTPVHKHASTLETEHPIYEQDNMVFQGTYVLAGAARALVVETGGRTEFGKIAQLATGERTASPVQAKIDSLVTMLVKVIGAAAAVVFLLSLARGIASGEALRFVLAFSVSAVPEGLPVALTVIIVLGMRRMATTKALVRSFKAIEDVGLITTIATDKTGTLTKNHLSVVDIWNAGKHDALQAALRTLDPAHLSDPLDGAIAEAHKAGAAPADKLYPFDIALRMSGAYSRADKLLYIKGSPEHILAKSHLSQAVRHQAESVMHEQASKGYRVIAVATLPAHGTAPDDLRNVDRLTFVGFLALADQLRPEAAAAIAAAQAAGISVRLITGDHYETAYNIGKATGIASHPNQIMQGSELPEDPAKLAQAIREKTVFARILPEDKFRILQALKHTDITAMTGDGVNDVPALANAHVGFAMGSGSDIAKDAGDIVLLNDNFATIVSAIREGRKIFDNIRKMLFYLLATSLGETITMIGALLLGLPLPVTSLQILWINLVTDTALVLPLGLEPEEEGVMDRPPRAPTAPLLGKILLSRLLAVAFTMALVTLGIVIVLKQRGHDTAYIQTVAFMALITAQWTNALNARSERRSSLARLRTPNKSMAVGFVIAFGLQMLVMFGPLAEAFGVQRVPIATLLASSGVTAVAVLGIAELHKLLTRKLG